MLRAVLPTSEIKKREFGLILAGVVTKKREVDFVKAGGIIFLNFLVNLMENTDKTNIKYYIKQKHKTYNF